MNRESAIAESNILYQIELSEKRAIECLRKFVSALEAENIKYAVTGGTAVAMYIEEVDPVLVRTPNETDIIFYSKDFWSAAQKLKKHGFTLTESSGKIRFIHNDYTELSSSILVHILEEETKEVKNQILPLIFELDRVGGMSVLRMDALLRYFLMKNTLVDVTFLNDLVENHLVKAEDISKLPEVLQKRYQKLLDWNAEFPSVGPKGVIN